MVYLEFTVAHTMSAVCSICNVVHKECFEEHLLKAHDVNATWGIHIVGLGACYAMQVHTCGHYGLLCRVVK